MLIFSGCAPSGSVGDSSILFHAEYIVTGSGDLEEREHLYRFDTYSELSSFMQDSVHVHSFGTYTETAENRYTEEWFQNHQLLLIELAEGSGSIKHEVICVKSGNLSVVEIDRIVPLPGEDGTDDIKDYTILIETERVFSKETEIHLNLNVSTRPRIVSPESQNSNSSEIAKYGEVLYAPGLIAAAENPDNMGKVFYVQVVLNVSDDMLEDARRKLAAWDAYSQLMFVDEDRHYARFLLTPQQLLDITPDENCGYYIKWLDYNPKR